MYRERQIAALTCVVFAVMGEGAVRTNITELLGELAKFTR